MSSNHFNAYSSYYDLIYQNKPYQQEVDFISNLIQKFGSGKRVLELGCGTGKHARLLNEKGFRVTGVDLSDSMLDVARESSSPEITFVFGDLRNFSLNNLEKFDIVIAMFDVVSYLPTNADIKKMLNNISIYLKKGGVLIFDAWYGPAVLHQRPYTRIGRWNNDKISITRISAPEMDYNNNICTVNYEIYIEDKKEGINKLIEKHPMRYFFLSELDELFSASGFSRQKSMEWFTANEPSENIWSVLHVFKFDR
ncbi:MAG: class I SAM-dependent methyltransferase [Emcibacteraceae bacterium]|nr:class I SAM-dependent methyltransferase [Emcibacteraceae bacterium]